MKFKILLAASMLLLAFNSQAQGGGRNGGRDPIQRAEMQTKIMVDSLSLSTKQGEKVKEINLKYANKQTEARQANTDGDWEQMRAKMDALRTEQNTELKTVLTQSQFDHWQKISEEMAKHRGGNGKGMDGRGNPGKNGTPPPPPPPPVPEQGGNKS